MLEIPFNQYYVEEIKYRISDTKSVVLKLHNWMIKDIEVVDRIPDEHENKSLLDAAGEGFIKKDYDAHEFTRELINKTKEYIIPNIDEKRCEKELYNLNSKKAATHGCSIPNTLARELLKETIERDKKLKKEDNSEFHKEEPNDKLNEIESLNDLYNNIKEDDGNNQ